VRLLKVDIYGFRRLVDVTINLDGHVIAVVGPNESGKSSLLDALYEFEDTASVRRADRARAKKMTDESTFMRAHYLLDEADRAALKDIPEAKDIRYFRHSKRIDGQHGYDGYPYPTRDLTSRSEASARLRRLLSNSRMRQKAKSDSEFADLARRAQSGLDSQSQKLHENDIDTIRQLAAVLEADDSPISARRMAKSLQVMADKEVTDHPRDIVRRRLIERMPRLLWFTDDDRNLLTTYDLSAVANEPPAALANLASLAGLDLIAVHDAIQAGDYALKETLLRKANTRLLKELRGIG